VHGLCGRNAARAVLRDARVGLPALRARVDPERRYFLGASSRAPSSKCIGSV
jgi:hypothetical protein